MPKVTHQQERTRSRRSHPQSATGHKTRQRFTPQHRTNSGLEGACVGHVTTEPDQQIARRLHVEQPRVAQRQTRKQIVVQSLPPLISGHLSEDVGHKGRHDGHDRQQIVDSEAVGTASVCFFFRFHRCSVQLAGRIVIFGLVDDEPIVGGKTGALPADGPAEIAKS